MKDKPERLIERLRADRSSERRLELASITSRPNCIIGKNAWIKPFVAVAMYFLLTENYPKRKIHPINKLF
jgi:hypothetical protein